jgi:MraZ protein
MFMGRYEHSIDDKGRLTIPARYRELLAEGAYVTLGFDKNLLVLTPETFENISQHVKQMSITDNDARLLKRLIFSNAERVEVDRSGRILIPQWLRTYSNIASNAMIVGVGEYFEIWSPELWALQNEKLQDSDANAQRFGGLDLPV